MNRIPFKTHTSITFSICDISPYSSYWGTNTQSPLGNIGNHFHTESAHVIPPYVSLYIKVFCDWNGNDVYWKVSGFINKLILYLHPASLYWWFAGRLMLSDDSYSCVIVLLSIGNSCSSDWAECTFDIAVTKLTGETLNLLILTGGQHHLVERIGMGTHKYLGVYFPKLSLNSTHTVSIMIMLYMKYYTMFYRGPKRYVLIHVVQNH